VARRSNGFIVGKTLNTPGGGELIGEVNGRLVGYQLLEGECHESRE
jgi:hypothetical protein